MKKKCLSPKSHETGDCGCFKDDVKPINWHYADCGHVIAGTGWLTEKGSRVCDACIEREEER